MGKGTKEELYFDIPAYRQQFEVRITNILFQYSHVQSDFDHSMPIIDYCSHVQHPHAWNM